VSEAGVQQAVQGSYCINGPDSGECVDFEAPAGPEQLSVVHAPLAVRSAGPPSACP
jgi:hypothetical protein